jgi:hypothetical protein
MAQDPVKKPKSAKPVVAPDRDSAADIRADLRKRAVDRMGSVMGPLFVDGIVEGRAASFSNQLSPQSLLRAIWAKELEQQSDHLVFVEAIYGVTPIGNRVRMAMQEFSDVVEDIRGATDESFDVGETLKKTANVDLSLRVIHRALDGVADQPPLAVGLNIAIDRVNLIREEIARGGPLPPTRTDFRIRSPLRRARTRWGG